MAPLFLPERQRQVPCATVSFLAALSMPYK